MSEKIPNLEKHFETWFRDYGSHVILNRAVPHIADGLKPSQRRVLHSLWELEDGRYNKVANVVGHTLKYHPHGDASVFETLVSLAQKGLLVDRQGNWGNALTGDGAAAARYIEARLSPFAKEVVFNKDLTNWVPSYDGRNKEPKTLPVKFPLLLGLGTEGIAVSLACKILPHNFNELCKAAVSYLKGEKFKLFPDFENGGEMDVSNYNDGANSGKVKLRAKIVPHSKHSLEIKEIPHGSTTISVRDSIIDAESKGKIKIRKVHDMTSECASIIIEYPASAPLDKEKAIAALYAFTDCEITHHVNAVVIEKDKPRFASVSEILIDSVQRTKELIKLELELLLKKLDLEWMKLSLEKIFIESKTYRELENAKDSEQALDILKKKLKPYLKDLRRNPTDEEFKNLLELRIRRITRYDQEECNKNLEKIVKSEKEAKIKLKNLTQTTISYFENLSLKFGTNLPRKTKIVKKPFVNTKSSIEILPSNLKVYVNREEGFIGTSLKKDEELGILINEKSDIAAISKDGTLKYSRPGAKTFYGLGILSTALMSKDNKVEPKIFNIIYHSPSVKNKTMAKRFEINGGFIRDKEYLLCGKSKGTIVYLKEQTKSEKPPKIKVKLSGDSSARKKEIIFDFKSLEVKNKEALGNIVSKYKASGATEIK
jgi:topoisomerase-4 subunit A